MATTLDDRCFLDPLKTIINPNPHPGAGGGPLPRTHIWSHEHHTVETEAAIPSHGPVSRLRVRDKVRVRAALARSLAVLAMPGLFRAMQPCNHAAVQPCGRATMRPIHRGCVALVHAHSIMYTVLQYSLRLCAQETSSQVVSPRFDHLIRLEW